MSFDIEKFKFSSDFLTKSEDEFKAEMQNRYKIKVRDIKKLYNKIHGNVPAVPEKDTKVDQPESTGIESVHRDQEV